MLAVILCHVVAVKEAAYDELVVEVKKLKEAATDSQSAWKNEKHKLSIFLAEKEQSLTVRVYCNGSRVCS